ncbi:MAG: hypothetical protein RLZZ338_4802, partial [Cyanobacteriota bacterium]
GIPPPKSVSFDREEGRRKKEGGRRKKEEGRINEPQRHRGTKEERRGKKEFLLSPISLFPHVPFMSQ